MILEVDEIHTFYGESHILFGLSIDITEKSEAVGILGRNGAGKTTTMKSIVGLVKVSSGKLRFEGQDITNNPPHTIAQKGIGYVPEDRRIFAELTVRENLIIGITRRDAIKRWTLDSVFDFFPVLKDRLEQDGITLSGGEQQMLTIARSLMGNPRFLLLDEPAEGLAPLVARDMADQLIKLKETGMTMLIAEHSSGLVYRLCDRLFLIEKGSIGWKGTPEQLNQDDDTKRKFLGV